MPMYKAVMNLNIQPIAQSFDISSYGKDSTGVVLDVTGFINTDNDILNFEGNAKRVFQVAHSNLINRISIPSRHTR